MFELTDVIRETWLSRRPSPAAFWVTIFSTALVFFGSALAWGEIAHLSDLMPAWRDATLNQHQYWRAWTTLLVHADPGHLISNSLLFFIFGYFLNAYFGTWVFPITTFIFGGITNLFVLPSYDPEVHLIGASGMVFWMGGAWLVLYFFLDRQRSLTQRALRSLGVAIMLFMPAEAFDPHISYRTHLTGFVLGLVWGWAYFQFKKRQFRNAEIHETIVEQSQDISPLLP